MRGYCALLLAGMLFSAAARAGELAVKVTVAEPAGIARRREPASGGVPFKKGQVRDVKRLALFDEAGKPVAAQFSRLASYEDGSVQWALVDLLADLPAKGRAEFVIKAGRPARPATPLKITETAGLIAVDTGVVRFAVGKKRFCLFESVTVGGKEVVRGGEVFVVGGRGELVFRDRKTKKYVPQPVETHAGKRCAAGRPARVKWEYRGPLRATLRADGSYFDGAGSWLGYTTRITAWAGTGLVRVEHSLRNSNPAEGNDAFIERAALSLKLALDARSQGAGEDWAAGGDGEVGLFVLNRHAGGVYRGPATYLKGKVSGGLSMSWKGLYVQKVAGGEALVEVVSKGPKVERERGRLGFTREGVFALADRSHKDSEIWFEFYSGERDAKTNAARAAACRSRLLLLAPGEYYSETESLGMGHFGMLADEQATYKKWGWKGWEDPKKRPGMAHEPRAFVPVMYMHDVTEDDVVEGNLLQFLRTGERGFFDWAEAYNGFFRCHGIYRRDWGPRWGVPGPRGERTNKGMGFGWYGPPAYDWNDTRMHRCHHYGRGIFDFYCMTGSVDSLEAGLDLAEEMSQRYDRFKRGGPFNPGRAFGRKWLTFLRAWQVTRDPKWKKIAEHWADLVLRASNWNEKRGYFAGEAGSGYYYFTREWAEPDNERHCRMPPRLKEYVRENGITFKRVRTKLFGVKGDEQWEITRQAQMFELSACHLAMERYARLFDSEPMKQRVVGMARGVRDLYWSPAARFMIPKLHVGWPDRDKPFDAWKWTDDPERQKISGYATRYTADMFARAYSFSKDPEWLKLAKRSWDRGSKRGYQATQQFAAPDEVGYFAYIRGEHNDTLLECSARMFYEVARAK